MRGMFGLNKFTPGLPDLTCQRRFVPETKARVPIRGAENRNASVTILLRAEH